MGSQLVHIADATIKDSNGVREIKKTNFNTNDIINLILEADKYIEEDTKEFAQYFHPTRSGLREIWSFVKNNIHYEADPKNYEAIKSPSMLWDIRQGDCKSFSLFTASILRNLGVLYRYRFAQYRGNNNPTHVYIVATLGGKDIVLDSVYHSFDQEEIFDKAYDYTKEGKRTVVHSSRLGNIQSKSIRIGFWVAALGIGYYYLNNSSKS